MPTVASQDGRTLDIAGTILRIKTQLASGDRSVPLIVQTIKPTIALEDMDKLTSTNSS